MMNMDNPTDEIHSEGSTSDDSMPPLEDAAEELKDELGTEVNAIAPSEERESHGGDASSSSGGRGMEVKLLREPPEKSTAAERESQGGNGSGGGGLIKEAIECTASLKRLLLMKDYIPIKLYNHGRIPDGFQCPIFKQIMVDPVMLSTDVTYDRPFILKWLREGKRTCPKTQQVLSHTDLIPNFVVRHSIFEWCQKHGQQPLVPLKKKDLEAVLIEADRAHLNTLLQNMASAISHQKDAAKQIRLLTERNSLFCFFFRDTKDAIPQLIEPLLVYEGKVNAHPDIQEDIIATLFNLSIDEDNKKPLWKDTRVIPLLYDSLKCGTINTRINAAASLSMLSALGPRALKPLVDLIEGGHPSATEDATQAILNLCQTPENRWRAAREGAVRVIVKKIVEGTSLDVKLSILVPLATNSIAIQGMVVRHLLGIIRRSTCKRTTENCAAMLYNIIEDHSKTMREISDEERLHGSITKLASDGTSTASRKAYGILARLSPNELR